MFYYQPKLELANVNLVKGGNTFLYWAILNLIKGGNKFPYFVKGGNNFCYPGLYPTR